MATCDASVQSVQMPSNPATKTGGEVFKTGRLRQETPRIAFSRARGIVFSSPARNRGWSDRWRRTGRRAAIAATAATSAELRTQSTHALVTRGNGINTKVIGSPGEGLARNHIHRLVGGLLDIGQLLGSQLGDDSRHIVGRGLVKESVTSSPFPTRNVSPLLVVTTTSPSDAAIWTVTLPSVPSSLG